MRYLYTLCVVCMTTFIAHGQWSDTQNQFYDTLHMPVAVAANNQGNSIVIRSYPDSGWIVIWEDSRTNFSDVDIYAQKYDKHGVAQWTANGIPVAAGPDYQQLNPSQNSDFRYYSLACTDSSNGFYVAWQDANMVNTHVTNKARVCIQHVRGNGTKVFADTGRVIAQGTLNDSYQFVAPQLIPDGNKGFFIGYIRIGFATRDVFVNCYRTEGNDLRFYGGQKFDPDVTDITSLGPCGIRRNFNYLEDYVYHFNIYPDLQGGCGIIWTFERNFAQPSRGPFVAYNKLCRVKKDSRVQVFRRTNDIATLTEINRFYKKDSVVALYNFHAFFYSQICLPNVVPNEVIENGGEGYFLLDVYNEATNPIYDLYYPKGVVIQTGGNANANVVGIVRRMYINNAVTTFHTRGYYGLADEVYDSIPYQLRSDDENRYRAYNTTRPPGLDSVKVQIDTLLASGTYYYDFQLTGGGNRALLTAKVAHPDYTNSGTILLQELVAKQTGPQAYSVEVNTTDKKGIVVGRELSTGFQNSNITYDLPMISMDHTGNALFYISEYGRYVRVSPIAEGGKFSWGAMGRSIGNTTSPDKAFAALGEDGTAVIAWHDGRPTMPNTTAYNVYMRHLDTLDVYDYLPPVKKLIGLNNFANLLPPYILYGLSNKWSMFDALTPTGWSTVAAIVDDYNFGNVQIQAYKNSPLSAIRTTDGKPYLDRNYTIFPQNNLTGGATAKVRLYFTEEEFTRLKTADPTIINPGSLGIVKQPNATASVPATYISAPTDELITPIAWGTVEGGYYLEISVNSFSNFFVLKSAATLPVTWVSIQAQWVNSTQAKVTWKVADEQQVKDYVVQHSTDGVSYTEVCTVPANGSTQYSCVVPADGRTNHYRVRQRDLDARSSVSRTVILRQQPTGKSLTLSPNPAADHAILRIEDDHVQVKALLLYNSQGKEVWRKDGIGANTTQIQIPLQQLSAGVYHLRISDGNQWQTLKLIKQ
ncbi:MAG: T9SS type A sorting domain-containing protein [Niastella sp.]|nr:T9SS type A sorting domain-containing protein [Niastella sp.]